MKLTKGLKTSSRKKTTEKTSALTTTSVAAPRFTPVEPKALIPDAVPGVRSGRKTVTIEAKIDVGFGNAVFLRGEGEGLSWDHGIPLECVGGSTWKWSAEAGKAMKFKLLLNDSVWAQGDDLVAAPGQRLELAPSF